MKDRNKIFRLLIDKVEMLKKKIFKGEKKTEDKENENIYKFYPLTANSTIKLSDVTNGALKYAVSRKTKVTKKRKGTITSPPFYSKNTASNA